MHSTSTCKNNRPNLYLVGMMGTGKSTIGSKLAEKLGMDFIDSDKSIEEKLGLSVNDIFTKNGESYFRKLECEFIEKGHNAQNQVIACGGGLCVPAGMMESLKSKGKVICLWACPETLLERTKTDQSRPLLQIADPLKELKRLIKERESRYREADFIIETNDLPVDAVVNLIVATLA